MLRRIVYPAVIVALPFLMYMQTWRGAPGDRKYFVGDTGDSYFPDLRAIELALFDGELPLWNPYERGGYPFAADPQPGVLYPLNWLLAVIGHLQGGVSFGLMQFKLLLHVALAGLSMYLFMRDRDQPEPSAAIAAVSYQFGAYFAHHTFFSLVWPFAWTPLLMRSLDRLFAQPSLATAFASASYMALSVHAGSPPAVFYSALIVLPYFLLRLSESLHGAHFRSWVVGPGAHLASAGAIGVILSLPQLLATAVLTKHSVLADASFDHAALGSILPEELLGLGLRVFSGLHWYAGISALFLACVGTLYYRERKEVAVFAGVVVGGMILMLGRHTLLFRIAYDLIPGVDRFRLCFRYVSLVSFGLSVLASFGLTSLLEQTASRRAIRGFAGCALLLIVLGLYLNTPKPELRDYAILRDLMYGGVLLGVAVAIAHGTLSNRNNRAGLAVAMVALLAVDYGVFLERAGTTLGRGVYEWPLPYTPPQLEDISKRTRGYRVFNELALGMRPGSRYRVRDLGGYFDPLMLGRYSAMMFEQFKYNPARVMALYNAKYMLFGPHRDNGIHRHFIPHPEEVAGFKRLTDNLYEISDPTANAYWVGNVTLRRDNPSVIRELSTVDYHQTALLAEEDLRPSERKWAKRFRAPSRPAVPARVLARSFNDVAFSVQAPADGLLVVNEVWFPGWRAYIDGEYAAPLRVNSIMQGVPIRGGSHRVELRFRPYYFLGPLVLAILTLVSVGALLLRSAWRRRGAHRLVEARG